MNSFIISPLLYSGVTVFLGKLLLWIGSAGLAVGSAELSVLDLISLGVAIFFVVQLLRAQVLRIHLGSLSESLKLEFSPIEHDKRSLLGQVVSRR